MASITRVTAAARGHHRVICLEELRDLGLSHAAVKHAVAVGWLWRVHRGVYAIDGPLTPHGLALAAVYRCRPRCAAARLTAAFLSDFADRAPAKPQVTAQGRSGATGPANIDLQHSRTLTVDEVEYRAGIPVTTPARTITDCARLLDPQALKLLVRRAEHHGLDLRALDRPGIPSALRNLLDHYVVGSGLTANELEARFYEICARIGVPRPEIQGWFPDKKRIDFVWRDHRLIAETDGRQVHDTFIAFTDDRVRDRAHTLAGFGTLRFTWTEVEEEAPVERDLLAFFSRR